MDKFGIFNLISSFLNFYNEEKRAETNGNKVNPFNALSSLFQGNNQQKNNVSPKNSAVKTSVKPPLQSSMLSVMKEHDAAVKRITKKNAR